MKKITIKTAALVFTCLFSQNTLALAPFEHSDVLLVKQIDKSTCHYIQSIDVSSNHKKQIYWQRHGVHKAVLKAQEIGATHLMIKKILKVGVFNGEIHSDAYQCKQSGEAQT